MKKLVAPPSARVKERGKLRVSFRALSANLLLLTLFCTLPARGQQQETPAAQPAKSEVPAPLKVSGTITSLRVLEEDAAVKVRLAVNLVAENTGQENLILLRHSPAANAEYLFTSPTGGQPLWVLSRPPGINGGQNHKQELQKNDLDQKEPPDDFTIVLNPGDTIGWDIPVELTFMKTVEPREIQVGTPPRPAWDVVKKSCPCWLKLDLDVWPMSLEPKPDSSDPALARKLSTRWKKKGTLIYTEQRSEGIALSLQPTSH